MRFYCEFGSCRSFSRCRSPITSLSILRMFFSTIRGCRGRRENKVLVFALGDRPVEVLGDFPQKAGDAADVLGVVWHGRSEAPTPPGQTSSADHHPATVFKQRVSSPESAVFVSKPDYRLTRPRLHLVPCEPRQRNRVRLHLRILEPGKTPDHRERVRRRIFLREEPDPPRGDDRTAAPATCRRPARNPARPRAEPSGEAALSRILGRHRSGASE